MCEETSLKIKKKPTDAEIFKSGHKYPMVDQMKTAIMQMK